jgi:CheY-like chemotaxis protein
VRSARDRPDGLAILKIEPRIDLLLSDVVLPGEMSGPDVAAEAKRHISDLKVLFMSG